MGPQCRSAKLLAAYVDDELRHRVFGAHDPSREIIAISPNAISKPITAATHSAVELDRDASGHLLPIPRSGDPRADRRGKASTTADIATCARSRPSVRPKSTGCTGWRQSRCIAAASAHDRETWLPADLAPSAKADLDRIACSRRLDSATIANPVPRYI